MRWYLESSHYTKELGDLMLDCIFGYRETGYSKVEDFGLLLTSNNIEEHLRKISSDRQVYQDTHKGDVAEIVALAKALLK